MTLQNSLANFSFLSLLGSMIFYWIGASFRDKTDNKPGFSSNVAQYGILISNILLGLLLLLRWKESGHFPLSNLYESLMFLSWCFTVIHLFIENYTFSFLFSDKKEGTNTKNNLTQNFVGAITTPSALLTNAFATFTLPKEMQESSPLVPALQSNWLMMHVTVMILSYAALIIGSLLSIAFLIVSEGFESSEKKSLKPEVFKDFPFFPSLPKAKLWEEQQSSFGGTTYGQPGPPSSPVVNSEGSVLQPLPEGYGFVAPSVTQSSLGDRSFGQPGLTPLAVMLDNLSYRILGIGFPLLTIGILSGAVWANEAWGSYWSWDPKETWALLTWLIFAIYLHTRLSKGWEGKKPAIIASFGFVIVWVCYLGVNLIGEGLHSYGWLSTQGG